MLKVRDMKCTDCNYISEEFLSSGVDTATCQKCGGTTKAIPSSPPFVLDGSTDGFPGRHMRWIKEHEQAGRGN